MAIDAETGEETDYDAQDTAEVLDEDNQTPDMVRALGDDETSFDTMPDVLDMTRAVGDDDDEALIGEDLDDEDIVRLSRESDQDDADIEDDDLRLRDADAYADEDSEDNDLADDDRDDLDQVAFLHRSEAGMRDAGDLNDTQGARSAAQRMESNTVSDEDLARLGYARNAAAKGVGENRSFSREKPSAEKNDISADPLPHESSHPDREDERLDEGVEETFPASDPVSVKHIT